MSGFAFDTVTCARGGRTLFAELSFALEPGDAALVTGPNGVGKSSLIRVAAGLLPPIAGRVVGGRRALLDEAGVLDGERTLAQALTFWAGIDGRDPHERVEHSLTQMALGDLADIPVRLLSTGQRRRAGLARIAASGAETWLLDEPANGLDADAVARLETAVATHRRGGGILLIATHLPIAVPGARTIALSGTAGGTT